LELPDAIAQLVKIFGPGSEAVTTQLLDDLAVDPSGDSRASWDIAILKAINELEKLKRDQPGDKGKQKGKGFHLFILNLR
jgi:hypothetical protein